MLVDLPEARAFVEGVDIFFIEDGTLWADKTRDFTEKTVAGDCPQDYFPYLEENEIMIGV